ncbi:hypothetical protein SADUNF_Sadunf06G0005900 [Salix dunnii]|uniref:GAG-pre-integrase domain-containing protein n=1 Tax=Salix dunnii TaxID=1413687 RepID=A0A835JXL7_9ROSI|nr:hypothetical protein SADUNF_Sadunf06G0005900 [Salix dunnii]
METENQQTPTSTMQSTSRFHNLSDHNNPYRLDNSDTSVLSLVIDLLTTENYVTWVRATKRVLRAKNKLGFVDGSITKPTDPNDPLLEAWERCNDMIVSWIHNSLKGALANLTQGNDSVNIYYGKLKSIWDELELHCPMPEYSCGQMKILTDRYQQDCDLISWTTIGLGEIKNGLYQFQHIQVPPNALMCKLSKYFDIHPLHSTCATNTSPIFNLWHYRLGHISNSKLKLIKDPIIIKDSYPTVNEIPCSICPMARQHKLPFDQSLHKSSHNFELIHCDLWGPCSVTAYDGSRYFLPIVDDMSRNTWVYLLKNKSDTQRIIEAFYNLVCTQFELGLSDPPCSPSNSVDVSLNTASSPKTCALDDSTSSLPLSDHSHSSIPSPSSPPHILIRKSDRMKQAPKYLQDFHCQMVSLSSPSPVQATMHEVLSVSICHDRCKFLEKALHQSS